jgi:hypothetical protein
MKRRTFLEIAGGSAMVGMVVGGRFIQQAHARDQLRQQLMNDAGPLLTEKAAGELESLPVKCRNEMREYFHGACLNVHGFVSELCSVSFGERLRGCRSIDEQHQAMSVLFTQKIASSAELINRVNAVATEAGGQLNRNWSECCKKLADLWQASVSQYGMKELDVDKLVEPLIMQSVEDARRLAYPIGQRPGLGESVVDIGKSALLLLPFSLIAPGIVLPVFVSASLKSAFDFIKGQLNNRPENYQLAISEHLAILGNRVGSEFETEIKKRVADLHFWQDRALRTAADQKANELIPSFL